MADAPLDNGDALQRYRDEVLRWNESFSLISRVETQSRLEELIRECRAAYLTLTDEILPAAETRNTERPLHYVDLGSGAGLPGLVWHLLSGRRLFAAGTLLVEPRRKRAWFLERAAAVMGLQGLAVGEDQWGPRTALDGGGLPPRVTGLITLKALRLSDPDILAGWRRYRASSLGDTVIICRFLGQGAASDEAYSEQLGLPSLERAEHPAEPWARVFPCGDGPRSWRLQVSIYPQL